MYAYSKPHPNTHAHAHGFDAAAGGSSAATITGQKNKCSHGGNGAGGEKFKTYNKTNSSSKIDNAR